MKITVAILGLFAGLLFSTGALAQVPKSRLIGNWKLVALENKNISAAEASRTYLFTDSNLVFTSINRNFKARYNIIETSGLLNLQIPGEQKMRQLKLSLHSDTLKITEGNSTGILLKTKPQP